MSYVSADAERLPFVDRTFDVVACFNALDHVQSVEGAIREMTRVARPGASLLLVVDVNHRPTHTEPHHLGWNITETFDGWSEVFRREFEHSAHGYVTSLRDDPVAYNHSDVRERWGILVSRLERQG